MASLNRVMIIGNVGSEPEMRFTPNGTPVTSFSVAVNERFKSGEEWQEKTEWFHIVAWQKLAETCNQFLTKGKQIYIEGKLQTRSWEGDGQKKYRTEIIASKVLFLGKKPNGEEAGEVAPATLLAPSDLDDEPF